MDESVTNHDRKGTGKGTGNMERIFVVEIQDQVQSVERASAIGLGGQSR